MKEKQEKTKQNMRQKIHKKYKNTKNRTGGGGGKRRGDEIVKGKQILMNSE